MAKTQKTKPLSFDGVELEYPLYCDNKLIAAFVHEDDREHCLSHLEETYPDCQFHCVPK